VKENRKRDEWEIENLTKKELQEIETFVQKKDLKEAT